MRAAPGPGRRTLRRAAASADRPGQRGQLRLADAHRPRGVESTVKLDGKTTVNKTSKGAAGDIKTGDTVIVTGAGPNAEGAATSVTILPQTGGN